MPFPVPMIVYDAGTGTTFVRPTYPPVQKPQMDDFQAVRHDSITSAGFRQSMLERIDRIRPVNFNNVPWSDLPMWEAFLEYAVGGGQFKYYPDQTLTAYATWELVDDNVKVQFVSRGLSKFTLNLRLVPGGASSA